MDIKNKGLERIVRQLKNLGCEFMIVPNWDAEPVSNGKFANHKKMPHGACTRYVDGLIKDLMPGDSVTIPYGEFPPETVSSVVPSRAFTHFGRGNYVTGRREDGTGVDLLCLDRDDTDNNTTGEE